MPDTAREGQPLKRRLLARIGNPLEWTDAGKVLVTSAVARIPIFFFGWLGNHLTLRKPAPPAYMDLSFMEANQWLVLAIMAGDGALALAAAWVRRRGLDARPLVYAATLYWSLTTVAVLQTLGTLTTPFWGFLVFGGIFYLILMDRRIGLVFFVTTLTGILAATLLEQLGLLRYAPMMRTAPYQGGALHLTWAVVYLLSLSGFTWIYYGLFDFIIARWKDREEKLAEAYVLLQAQKDELVRAESLAAVGSLVTGAAHELRNPLGSSSALFQSLKEDIQSSSATPAQKDDALQTIAMALKGQQRAADIAERLYSLSDSLAHVDAMRPLGAILEALKSRYPAVGFVGAHNAAPLPVNDRAVTTILANLLDNALSAGGKDAVRLEVRSPGEETAPLQVEFVVSDSGRGISKAQQAEVFKPFFTGQKAGEGHGVGLGLYIVHELVTRMGGRVELESAEDKGTSVRILLPTAQGP